MLLNEIWGSRFGPSLGDREKRDFKRREMEHELRHEDETDPVIGSRTQWARRPRPQQSGGKFYIQIGGKIWKKDGQPVTFGSQQAAQNAADKIRARMEQRGDSADIQVMGSR